MILNTEKYNLALAAQEKCLLLNSIVELKSRLVGVAHTRDSPELQEALVSARRKMCAAEVILSSARGKEHLCSRTKPETLRALQFSLGRYELK